jgi:hypothetical protein
MDLPFTLKKYLKAKKKNYENSNISPCKKHNLPKKNSSIKETPKKSFKRYYKLYNN